MEPGPEGIAQMLAIEAIKGNLGPVIKHPASRVHPAVVKSGRALPEPLLQRPLGVETPTMEERERRLVAASPVVAKPGMDLGSAVVETNAEDIAHRLMQAE